jgi:hypothetical protein
VVTAAGFSHFRRAAETPFSVVYEARPRAVPLNKDNRGLKTVLAYRHGFAICAQNCIRQPTSRYFALCPQCEQDVMATGKGESGSGRALTSQQAYNLAILGRRIN